MSILATIGAVAAGVTGAVKLVTPVVKSIFGSGTAKAATGAAIGTSLVTSGGQQIAAPIMSGVSGLPGLTAATQSTAIQQSSAGGLPLPWWKGPGGKLQMPWNDPRIPEYLKSFSIDDAYLKTYVRAPKGYVVVRDAQGRPFGVNKTIARQFGLWKPAAKPPISATDWKHFKRNKAIEKKIKKNFGSALKKTTRTITVTKKK